MKLEDVKLKDLGKVTSEAIREKGEDILGKTEDKAHEFKEKMVESKK